MTAANDKSPSAYRTISEVAESMDLPQHVLRFWETRFPQIRPLKRGGGRRYYRPEDVELLKAIKRLLYDQGYTIKGVQRMLREQGAGALIESRESVESVERPARAPAPPTVALIDDEASSLDDEQGFRPAALDAEGIAALRAALADVREARRQLGQNRAS